MGCDIHLTVEFGKRNYLDGISFPLDRCYLMFGLMAGARGKEVIYERRGLPEGLSTPMLNRYNNWKEDAHTMSWLTCNEYKKCVERYCEILRETYKEEEYNIETDPNPYFVLLSLLQNLEKRYKLVRIVFFFDN